MNDPAPRVVALGDLTADLIVEVPELPIRADDFLLAEEMRLEPGGSANLLILLARLGASAVALGTLGEDTWGEEVYQILRAEEVDVSLIRRQGTTTVALVLVDAAGRHGFVGAYGKGKPLNLGDCEKRVIAAADALFASGYSLAERRLRDLTLAALDLAGQEGVPRFFDPGPAFAGLPSEVQRRSLAGCDVLLLTEEELGKLSLSGKEALRPSALSRILSGNSGIESEAVTQSKPPADTRERSGPHTVVVKRGAAGCCVYADGLEGVDLPGLPVTVRDTTAAGDCFAAGYIWAHLRDRSPEECARLANCAGSAAVGKIGGGRNVPTVGQLREMIRRTIVQTGAGFGI
jgi:ribokinase